jgi:hypothetical protein
MKHLIQYRLFEANEGLTKSQSRLLDFICAVTGSDWEYNENTGLVDVKGSFLFPDQGFTDREMKEYAGIKFGTIEGDFNCSGNYLKTLEGSPRIVNGDFKCSVNKLSTLEGGPIRVDGDYVASSNSLNSLKGSPEKVGGSFNCTGNPLKNLEYGPKEVGGDFDAFYTNLESTYGAPESIGLTFTTDEGHMQSWNADYFIAIFNKITDTQRKEYFLSGIPARILNEIIEKNPETGASMIITLSDMTGFDKIRKDLKYPDGFDKYVRTRKRFI